MRPMRFVELQHAVAIEVGDEKSLEDGLSPEHMIISSCAGLMALESNPGMGRFINMAVQEHIPSLTARWFPNPRLAIFEACATCLRFSNFETTSGPLTRPVRSEFFCPITVWKGRF
jgi:hypothetical protein